MSWTASVSVIPASAVMVALSSCKLAEFVSGIGVNKPLVPDWDTRAVAVAFIASGERILFCQEIILNKKARNIRAIPAKMIILPVLHRREPGFATTVLASEAGGVGGFWAGREVGVETERGEAVSDAAVEGAIMATRSASTNIETPLNRSRGSFARALSKTRSTAGETAALIVRGGGNGE